LKRVEPSVEAASSRFRARRTRSTRLEAASTLAVVERRWDYQETSRLVQMFTRDYGRLTFLAKGAHRPKSQFLGAIDLFHVVEARVGVRDGRGLQIVHGLRVLQGNAPFRADPLRRGLAERLADLLRLTLPEGRVDPEVFDLYRGALALYARAAPAALATVDAGVRLRLLAALGFLPDPTVCPRTGQPLPARGSVGFAPEWGGFVDVREGGQRLPAELAALAGTLLALEGRKLGTSQAPRAPLARLHELIDDLYDWHLGERGRVGRPERLLAIAGPGARIRP
jgi:DNA repair protein RecO (recombination protein O)